MSVIDTVSAFCAYAAEREGRVGGALAGVTFAAKDLFDVAGVPTGAGSPQWLESHPVPTATAPAVQRLLDAGARLVGKTHTDELAWSLNGQNHHYGTPSNVAAPGRLPGGSSSGSAAATAAGLVDVALGSDTGGSVRLPASYGGLYGIRTTHGRISLAGVVPLAPSYDTVGWFARDPALFAKVGTALLVDARPVAKPRRLLLARDLFAMAGRSVTAALDPAIQRFVARIGPAEPIDLASGQLASWRDAFRTLQSAEAWSSHGAWIEAVRPTFGPGVRERFADAARLDPAQVAAARALREQVRRRLAMLLPPGTVLLAPVTPGIAPLIGTPAPELDVFRAAALALLCPAGHAGLPQLSLPIATLEGCPLGLGILAGAGEDESLLALAATGL